MPWHKIQDELEEERLSKSRAAFGSTKRGIAYAYSDKYRKKTIRLGDLLHLDEENVQARLKTMLEAKNLELAGCYHQEPMSLSALLSWCRQKAAKYAPYITDTGAFLEDALSKGKRVVLEAQLGAIDMCVNREVITPTASIAVIMKIPFKLTVINRDTCWTFCNVLA